MAATDLVLALTGASGSIYGVRLLEVLLAAGRSVYLTLSPAAVEVLQRELGRTVRLDQFEAARPARRQSADGAWADRLPPLPRLPGRHRQRLLPHGRHGHLSVQHGDRGGRRARTVAKPHPAGGGRASQGAPPAGPRAARDAAGAGPAPQPDHLRGSGAVILPAMPGFYTRPKSLDDLVDFVVGRVCDQLGVAHRLFERWGQGPPCPPDVE